LEGAMGCGDEPTNRCAHRLKGNLNALGLVSFATKAGNIEKAASFCGETEIKAAVLDLYHSLAATPFI